MTKATSPVDTATGEALRIERHRAMVRLVFCRPEELNLYDEILARELARALFALRLDETVDLVVITGEGRAFSGGADLRRESAEWPSDDLVGARQSAHDALVQNHALFRLLETLPQTTVAGLNGHAFGAGLVLAILCDIIIASDQAKLGFTMARFGLADGITTTRLVGRVGKTVANDLLLTGRHLSSAEAADLRLINRSVAARSFDLELEKTVEEVRQASPQARRQIKAALRSNDTPYDFETHLRSYTNEDVTEGGRAFMEKRRPRWAEPD